MRKLFAAVALAAIVSLLSQTILAGEVRPMDAQQMKAAVGGAVPGCLFTGGMCGGTFPPGCVFTANIGCSGASIDVCLTADYNKSCIGTPNLGPCNFTTMACVTWKEWGCTTGTAPATCIRNLAAYVGSKQSGVKGIAFGAACPF